MLQILRKLLLILVLSYLITSFLNKDLYADETNSNYEDSNIYFEIIPKDIQSTFSSVMNQSQDTLIYEDFPLDLLISVLTKTDKKNIKIQAQNYQSKYFDAKVLFKNKHDEILTLLKNALEKTLNLKIEEQATFSHYYQLQISDTAKLNTFRINHKPEGMQIRSSCLNINYMNANLSAIANNLSEKTNDYIEYAGDNRNYYSFEVRNFDLDKLAIELSEHIGLNLLKSYKFINYIIISQ